MVVKNSFFDYLFFSNDVCFMSCPVYRRKNERGEKKMTDSFIAAVADAQDDEEENTMRYIKPDDGNQQGLVFSFMLFLVILTLNLQRKFICNTRGNGKQVCIMYVPGNTSKVQKNCSEVRCTCIL